MPPKKTKTLTPAEGLALDRERGREIYFGPFQFALETDSLVLTDVTGRSVAIRREDHVSGVTTDGHYRTGGYVVTLGPDYLYVKLGNKTFPVGFQNKDPGKSFMVIAHEAKEVVPDEPAIVKELEPVPKDKTKVVKKRVTKKKVAIQSE